MDELHHNLEVRPYNNTTVSNFWGALQNGWFVLALEGHLTCGHLKTHETVRQPQHLFTGRR